MGVYYKIVNRGLKERIEPDKIGEGGIKFGAMCAGPSARLFMFLHLTDRRWTILDDCGDEYSETEDPRSPNYLADATEKYRVMFNERWTGTDHHIPRSPYADEDDAKEAARLAEFEASPSGGDQ